MHLRAFIDLKVPKTRRNIVLLTLFAVGLLTSSFAGIQTAKASVWVMVDYPWNRITGVNQPTEFTASGTGGTPPYTFQWYTTFLDPNVPSQRWIRVAVPGANSSTFNFVASTPGRYGISISVTDSKGEGEYQSFQPIGIVVTVQSTPVSQSMPSPPPNPSPTPSPPNITSLSAQDKTYKESNVPLDFTLSQPAQWIGYSLDGQANITIDGNTTLTGLQNGQHTVTIYANNTYGNPAVPQTITFIIKVPIPFPITEVAVAIIIIIAGAAVTAVTAGFMKKRKRSVTQSYSLFFIRRRTAAFPSASFFSANSKVSSAANSFLTNTPVRPTASRLINA